MLKAFEQNPHANLKRKTMTIFSDKMLSQKLERAEARATAAFVESHAKLFPESGAEWIEIAGVYAMFDGAESPSTQTYGLGVFDEITSIEIEKIETFFKERNAPVLHEVSPMADISIITLLNERGYQPIELTSVMYRTLGLENSFSLPKTPQISTRIINKNEVNLWAETSAKGWSTEMPDFSDFMFQFAWIGAQSAGVLPFIAELNNDPIATGGLFIYGDVALLSGASTIPEGRNKGAQSSLLDARLQYAAEKGCTIAVMGALPGSQSQKNAEKNGFRIAYTRTKWQMKS